MIPLVKSSFYHEEEIVRIFTGPVGAVAEVCECDVASPLFRTAGDRTERA